MGKNSKILSLSINQIVFFCNFGSAGQMNLGRSKCPQPAKSAEAFDLEIEEGEALTLYLNSLFHDGCKKEVGLRLWTPFLLFIYLFYILIYLLNLYVTHFTLKVGLQPHKTKTERLESLKH